VNPTAIARRLRRDQTDEEKELWRALRAGRFAGFKFRRQHPVCGVYVDFFCPTAKLVVELDGFQHGLPEHLQRDAARDELLAKAGIETLRFWNHQWNRNRDGVLMEIWHALHRRTGVVQVLRKTQNNRFVPPRPEQWIDKPQRPS
jgi:very-short-patch-repair endonuclease